MKIRQFCPYLPTKRHETRRNTGFQDFFKTEIAKNRRSDDFAKK